MAIIQQYPTLVIRVDGKNVGIPLIPRSVATLEDLAEMETSIREDLEFVENKPVAITTSYVPVQTSGIITVSPPSIPELKPKDIGRMVVFGGGTAVGIVTGISTIANADPNNPPQYLYATIKLIPA